jgi:hypothetical protein
MNHTPEVRTKEAVDSASTQASTDALSNLSVKSRRTDEDK